MGTSSASPPRAAASDSGPPAEPATRPRLRDHRRLVVLTTSLAAGETALLHAVGLASAAPLGPQVVAPAPFGVFHDLRWLLVYHATWLGFVVELLALLAVRSTLDAALVVAAWPRWLTPPDWRTMLRRSAGFTAAAVVLLSIPAALLLGLGVFSLSWLFYVAVPLAFAISILVHHGPVTGAWWSRPPRWRSVGWIVLTFFVLSLGAAAIVVVPWWLAIPAAAATGLFDAWAWVGIVHALAAAEPPARPVPLAPVGLVALATVLVVGTVVGFGLATRTSRLRHIPAPRVDEGRPVLLVAGFDSTWDGQVAHELPGRFREERFSYRGLAATGQPLPYTAPDTHASLPELARRMAEQVERLHRQTGRPVSIVAESEGALLASVYVAGTPGRPVDTLVMLSPLVRPGRDYYPPRDGHGWGLVAGREFRVVTDLLHATTPLSVTPDTPLFRSIVDHGPLLRGLLSCPVPGVDRAALFPVADAVAARMPSADDLEVLVVPAFHGGLLGDPSAQPLIGAALTGATTPRFAAWAVPERIVRDLATAWQVPELPVGLNPVWSADADATRSCAARRDAIAAWIRR